MCPSYLRKVEYSEDDLPSPANSTPEKKHDFFDPQAKVRFKFGLISVGKSSPADGYLEAIDQIVTKVLGEETKQTMGFGYPSISKVENDCKYYHSQCHIVKTTLNY